MARSKWVDITKGLGILIVVFGHAICGNYQSIIAQTSKTFYLTLFNFIWNFHMPLFFFLSGLFIDNWAKRPVKVAVKNKLYSVMYPYAVWSIIVGGFYLLLNFFPKISSAANMSINFKQFLLFPIFPYIHLWFLQALFYCQLIYLVLDKNIKASSGKKLLLIFTFALMLYFLNIFKVIPSYFSATFNNFIYVVLGACFMAYPSIHLLKISKITQFMIIFSFMFINMIMSILNTKIPGIDLLIASLGILSFISIALIIENKAFSNKLAFLGEIALVIYLTHVLVTPAARIILLKFVGIDNALIIVIAGTTVGIIVPTVFYFMVQRFNLTRLLFGK